MFSSFSCTVSWDCQEFQAVCLWKPWGVLGEESDMTTCILRGLWEPGGSSSPSLEPVASNSGHCPGELLSCTRRGGNSAAQPVAALASRLSCHPSLPCPACRYFQNVSVGTLCCLHPGQWLTSGSARREPRGRGAAQPWHVGAPITAHDVHRYQADANCLLPALSANFYSSPTSPSPRPPDSPQSNVHGLWCGSYPLVCT